MLLATYGAPSPPRGKNPLVIILGVCGGCVLIVVIAVVVMGVMGANMFKGIIGGAMQSQETTRKFVSALESHDYSTASAQFGPSASGTYTSAKLKSMEEQIEKKLGPIQTATVSSYAPTTNTIPGPNGKPQYMEYVYTVPLRFQKGNAMASIHYRSDDLSGANDMRDISKMKIPGKITSFKLSQDSE